MILGDVDKHLVEDSIEVIILFLQVVHDFHRGGQEILQKRRAGMTGCTRPENENRWKVTHDSHNCPILNDKCFREPLEMMGRTVSSFSSFKTPMNRRDVPFPPR